MMTPDPETIDPYAWTKDAPPTPEIDEQRIASLAKRHRTLVDTSDLNQEDIRRVEFEITEIEYRTSVTLPELDAKDDVLVGDIEVIRRNESSLAKVREVQDSKFDGVHYERGKIQCERILLDWERNVLIKQLEEEKEIERRVEDRMREWIYDVLTLSMYERSELDWAIVNLDGLLADPEETGFHTVLDWERMEEVGRVGGDREAVLDALGWEDP